MRNVKFNHLVFHILIVLATIALASIKLFEVDSSDENAFYMYQLAAGIAHLVAGTLIGGSMMFFTVENYWKECAEFDKTMLIPLIPSVLLVFGASELLADAAYVDGQIVFYWVVGLGIANCLFIPKYKTFSLHAVVKVISIIFYLMTFFAIIFEGPWFTLSVVFAGLFSLFSLLLSYSASENY